MKMTVRTNRATKAAIMALRFPARGTPNAASKRAGTCGTEVLRDYLKNYAIDVSSPGTERPLRRRPHFERVVGRTVAVRTADRKRVRGQLVGAGERTLSVDAGKGEPIEIPYDSIVRGNLIEEGAR